MMTYTKGPWAVSWFTCRADADDVKYEANRKLRKGEIRKTLEVGDALWRVPTAVGPVAIEHDHWAGQHLAISEEDARLIAAAPELVEALRDAANRIDDMLEGDDGQAWGEARQSAARFRALLARIEGDEA